MLAVVVALAVGLVVGTALLAVDVSNLWIPALGERQRRLAALKRGAAGRRSTGRLGESLARQEASLAERERIVERSLVEARKSIAEATARIEEREAALNIREAELRHQESNLEDRRRSVDELERELIETRPVPQHDERLGSVDSWWEKQLGPATVGEGLKRPR